MLYNKSEICAIIADTATAEGLPPEFVLACVDVLSSFNPALIEQSLDPQQYNPALARNIAPNARYGLLQVSYEAAKEQLEFKGKPEELLAPSLNVSLGCRILKSALAQCGGNAERSLLVCYGYSINTMIPRIQGKIGAYKQFIARRPTSQATCSIK